jgi:hypothetical protein
MDDDLNVPARQKLADTGWEAGPEASKSRGHRANAPQSGELSPYQRLSASRGILLGLAIGALLWGLFFYLV